MMKKTAISSIIFLSFLLMVFLTPLIQAGECQYGAMNVFFSRNQKNWKKATVTNVSLDRGEVFYLKAEITSKIKLLSINLHIWETGEDNPENSTFKILNGYSCFFRIYDVLDVEKNKNFTFFWKFQVKNNTDWFNASAPLNIFAQYNKNPDDNKKILFTAVNPYINYTVWENFNPNENYSGKIQNNNYSKEKQIEENQTTNTTVSSSENRQKIPGFEIFIFIISSVIVTTIFIIKKHILKK